MKIKEVIKELNALSNPEKVEFKRKKFGIIAHQSLGIYHSDLKLLAKKIGHQPQLAFELIDSNIYEGRLLGSKILKPKDITEAQMEAWIPTFENWEICDSFCMGLFSKTPFAVSKINSWATRKNEFEKRAAFATLSSYCMADKNASNSVYESFIPLILNASDDQRIYVKKAVNWALRSIGKRNPDLNKAALICAHKILEMNHKSAQWIAKDAIKELSGENVKILDYPRNIYRPKAV